MALVNTMSRETILREYLKMVKDFYDVIILDCTPSLGMLREMLERLAELNAMLNTDQAEEPEDVNEKEEEAEESAREEPETETKDKNVQSGVEEASWTLQKIKEMRKKNNGGLKTVRAPKMIKKNNGAERM